MDRFIRIDTKGTWKGIEHRSCFAGTSLTEADEDIIWENGISCYKIYEDDKVSTIESLYNYWINVARLERAEDYINMQITIFEGEKLESDGSDSEDMAICIKTLKELDAVDFMRTVFETKDKLDGFYENPKTGEYEDEISIEEYNKILESLI